MTIAVYVITNKVNGHIYIGSSKHCEKRFVQHEKALDAQRHHCTHLQSAWNKYGKYNFHFSIEKEFQTIEEAQDYENQLLKIRYGKNDCYNSSPYAKLPFLHKHVRERAVQSALKSKKYKDSHAEVCRKRNSDPEFLKKLKEAINKSEKHKNAVKKNASTILQRPDVVAKNREALKNSVKQKDAARKQVYNVLMSPEIKAKNLLITSVAVVGTNIKTGEIISFSSQSEAARYVGCSPSGISSCCNGKVTSVKGYVWKKQKSPA